MNFIFAILAILASVLLTLVIIVQNSKGGGLSSAFGASNLTNMIGNRRASQDIEKFTWYLIGGLMVICFLATISTSSGPVATSENFGSLLEGVPTQAAPPANTQPAGQPLQPGQ